LFAASATLVASTRQRDALSPAGLTIAALVYVSFAVIAIVRFVSAPAPTAVPVL